MVKEKVIMNINIKIWPIRWTKVNRANRRKTFMIKMKEKMKMIMKKYKILHNQYSLKNLET